MNIVTLYGNLTRDPEVKVVKASGRTTSVATFGLAISRVFKKNDGTKDKDVTFVECEAWDTGAETIGKFLSKGSPLLVEGSLRMDSWEKDGERRSRLVVRVNRFHLMPKREKQEEPAPLVPGVPVPIDYVEQEVAIPDDIPF